MYDSCGYSNLLMPMSDVPDAIAALSTLYKETRNSVYTFRSKSYPKQILLIDKFVELLQEFEIVGESDVYYDLDCDKLFICNHYKGLNCDQEQNLAVPKIAQFIKHGTISGVDTDDGVWKSVITDGIAVHNDLRD